ncbi:hypothetical protein Kkor_2341 [Kangiella koreensis DSM 16069]|uniref:Uncharacterized protein n=1 Tax=Kangiella koreensis (strain DSM 16069 / JCM 12317 / KCTC 12182 / SW-125) TaxID=523791 RepID=C7R8I5_KANKD|nr:hypothetical protein Kkor_2341 [Kangiella koreensis DSM 16069]
MNTNTKKTFRLDLEDVFLDVCWVIIALLLVGMLIFSII